MTGLGPAPTKLNPIRRGLEPNPIPAYPASMTDYLLILISTVLVNNFVLVKFLGLCPFMGVSKKLETATGMSLATTFVLTLSSICSYLSMNTCWPRSGWSTCAPSASSW